MRTPPFQQRLKNYTLGSGRLPLSILLSSREDSEGNFCFATLGSHVSRPPGKPPRPLPPAFHHFLPPGGHHHLQHWSSSHEITKSQQLSSSPSLHQPHPPAPAGSVGQLVPPEQMVRNAGSSKERRRGAFIMRIQLNPGNGQCGLGKVPGRGGRGRGRCRSLGRLMLRLLSIVYLVRLILKPIRADFRFKIKLLVFFLYFLPKAHSMVYQELGQCLPVNTGQLMLMAVRRSTTNQSAAIHILLSLVYITPPRVANLIAFIRYIAQP